MTMPPVSALQTLEDPQEFVARHIGIGADDEAHMLSVVGAASRAALIAEIRNHRATARSARFSARVPGTGNLRGLCTTWTSSSTCPTGSP